MRTYLLELPDLVCLVLVYAVSLLPRWRANRKELFLKTVFFIYLCFVLHFTLLPLVLSFRISAANINLVPFRDFLMGHGGALKEFLLNVLMMIPFGVFLPMIYKKKFFRTVEWTLGFSLTIEILQIFSGGSRIFDVSDMISNTLGGMVGFTAYLPFRPAADSPADRVVRNGKKDGGPGKMTKAEKTVYGVFLLQVLVKSVVVAYL